MKKNVRGIRYWIEHYHQGDSLPVLVMLHGFMGSSGSFFHLTESLNDVVNVILIDLIGHGETESPYEHSRYTLKEQAADLKEILDPYSKYPIILYGYSMGGRLALQYACKYPETLSGIVLESTTAGIIDPAERVKRKKLDRTRAMHILENKDRFITEWNNSALFRNKKPLPENFEDQLEAIQQAQNSIGMQNSLVAGGTGAMLPLHDQLPALNIPALVITGANDDKFKQEGRILCDLLPQSTFLNIQNASHRIHLDNPEELLKNMTTFIQAM